jgi:hypothetical protein
MVLTLPLDQWHTTTGNLARQGRRLPRMATRHQGPRRKPSLPEPDVQTQVQVQPFISYWYVLTFSQLPFLSSCFATLLCPSKPHHPSRPANIRPRTPRSNLPLVLRSPNTHTPTHLLERYHLSRPTRPTRLVTSAECGEHMHESAEYVDWEHEE